MEGGKIIFFFIWFWFGPSILILSVRNREGGGGGVAKWKKSIKHDKSCLSKIPKKSIFSKSLIVMKFFKYLICIFFNTELYYWTAKAWLKIRRKKLRGHPILILGNGSCVKFSFYLNHRYNHTSKQILEHIFCLNKYMESWDAILINQLTMTILQQQYTWLTVLLS